MRRGDRLFELIEVLRRARGPVSAATIAKELEVSTRTVYRDMAALMAQRVPIRGEAGVGYVLDAGFHMPPLMLTASEVEAAILGAQWVRTRAEPELARAAQSLIAKIETVAPANLQTTFVDPSTSVAPVSPPPEVLGADQIRAAIRRRKKIRLTYLDAEGNTTDRVVWPILVGYRDHGRIIAAWCELRTGFRYFRTERIAEAQVLDDPIPRRMDHLRADWQAAMTAERQRYAAPENSRPADDPDQ